MKDLKLIIFDLDGTLYSFDKGQSTNFSSSQFYADIKKNAYAFFSKKLEINLEQAEFEFKRIKSKYNGEISLAVEPEYNINRFEYFENTWNLDPSKYLTKNMNLRSLIQQLDSKLVILTSAPRIWAESALKYLDVYDLFENNIFSGEPDIRKPNPLVFQKILETYKIDPLNACSIGDQEKTDIIPAKSLGIKTIIVGSKSSYADFSIDKIEDILNILKIKLK